MAKILVAGSINWETTVKISGFPLSYNPVNYPFWGVNGTVSGVGYNIAKALTQLGHEVDFLGLIGQDQLGEVVLAELAQLHISTANILPQLSQTPQSCILYEETGRRQIHVDLKDIQTQVYPPERAAAAVQACDLAVLCNINFSRPFLPMALAAGKIIATDVHALSQLEDDYNRDYMTYAHLLFMSHEQLPEAPPNWARRVIDRYGSNVVVIGMGGEGAMLATKTDGRVDHFPATPIRPIQNTIGAGDALFSAFIHGYLRQLEPQQALREAMIFAAYKIGERGAAEGFLTADELQDWVGKVT